jgi:hypothetical protein
LSLLLVVEPELPVASEFDTSLLVQLLLLLMLLFALFCPGQRGGGPTQLMPLVDVTQRWKVSKSEVGDPVNTWVNKH